ncbi:conserved Plasmodium protein, unknown function [Plasmodium reichenowi]|uniref:Transcription factor Pcc1 n=6 Tax=Plasmodium (Laverania) TaxID=418107 RepID=C6KSV2_PLAF7|nr:hypothetical protein PRSY57_0609400 [Plasmodium reichenowi]XP_966096.1 conserved Plasmodium protein, unknown function [Plasmodium falciparum 3D7]ETW50647.1 hypothetical protein PFMALIP_01375 [Plasmodium falciparum MaliPS096_E11]EUT90115.1 hypothetical protein PFAG_01315 [Plasmodium falciparum Santa Lucia]KAF4327749.1 hypothetical protein CYL21_4404 [Plasmodium falciparum NF54]KNG78353.1 hypothetical protein PFMG_04403 [Plasmodium falciparum IGH-CR14]SOS77370.1 conserved Plasmodium protein,|eukprot:XP_966096.1 conserved Plasmodium protein, unknown function [Plasmodium falciparum 3D7]
MGEVECEKSIKHIIEINCLSEKNSNILYKCLLSDDSLKQNEMFTRANVSGSILKIELQSNTCEDIRYKAKNIYDYLHFFFKTVETFA